MRNKARGKKGQTKREGKEVKKTAGQDAKEGRKEAKRGREYE